MITHILDISVDHRRLMKIRKIDNSVFHCVVCSWLFLLCCPEVGCMSTFLTIKLTYFAQTFIGR